MKEDRRKQLVLNRLNYHLSLNGFNTITNVNDLRIEALKGMFGSSPSLDTVYITSRCGTWSKTKRDVINDILNMTEFGLKKIRFAYIFSNSKLDSPRYNELMKKLSLNDIKKMITDLYD